MYRMVDPNNAAAGLVGFHQQYRSPSEALTLSTRDRDVAWYVQDSWRPNSRVTANVGIRVNDMQLHVSREFLLGVSVFNLLNNGAMTQWNTGANQIYSPNYLSRFNRTSSRQLQLSFKYRF